jgi:hypothetical protein
MPSDKNAMEVLAAAAYYIPEMVRGVVGSFKIDEEGWGEGDGPRAMAEIGKALAALKEAGFKDVPKVAARAPYTSNIRCGAFFKKFPGDKRRWVTLVLAERFGVDATFEVVDKAPWA